MDPCLQLLLDHHTSLRTCPLPAPTSARGNAMLRTPHRLLHGCLVGLGCRIGYSAPATDDDIVLSRPLLNPPSTQTSVQRLMAPKLYRALTGAVSSPASSSRRLRRTHDDASIQPVCCRYIRRAPDICPSNCAERARAPRSGVGHLGVQEVTPSSDDHTSSSRLGPTDPPSSATAARIQCYGPEAAPRAVHGASLVAGIYIPVG